MGRPGKGKAVDDGSIDWGETVSSASTNMRDHKGSHGTGSPGKEGWHED